MTFPTTGILDDFNRADECPPPSASWHFASFHHVTSNELASDPGGSDSWWGTQSGPDCEVYVTVTVRPADSQYVRLLIRWEIATSSGYLTEFNRNAGNVNVSVERSDNGFQTSLDTTVVAFADGDAIGLKATGDTIEVYHKPFGGAWTLILSVTDATYGAAGYIGLLNQSETDIRFDDFGGGTVASPEPPNPTEPTMVFSQCGPEPILRINDGTEIIDLLANDSGWELEDPYWNPQIAQYKSGGSYVNAGLAEGQRLVHKEYDNVIETIPLSVRGINQNRAIQTVRRLLQKARQASDYWTKPYEYDDVWIEAKPAGSDCLIGYARVIKMSIPELTNPFGQPFFSSFNEAIMNGITLTVEREPLWRGVPPGEIIGPLYNLIKNPDFELWNFGTFDSQPDSWTDLETIQITGQNSREATSPNSGLYSLKIRVSGSTLAGRIKGVTQPIENIKDETEYTVVAWVRSEGVSNGVGRILLTYSSQLEVYRASTRHGWTLYTGKFTTGTGDSVAVNLEILTTAANTDGTIYIDSLMLLEGDWETEAANGTLPYLSGSHIVNHWDKDAGNINWIDVWNIPGDEDALTRIEFMNNTTPADMTNPIEIYNKVRIGLRRTNNILNFDNYHDPIGITDATASAGSRVDTAMTAAWVDVTTKLITGGVNTNDNVGRYRLLARVYDSDGPTLQARLRYFLGIGGLTNQKILNAVSVPIQDNWCIVDLTLNAAMIIDRKFSVDPLAQFGYTLQMSRASGLQNSRLDYVLAIPTDGGYFEATVNPGIGQNTALIIDNTASLQVSIAGIKSGYVQIFDTGNDRIVSFVDFKGYLYAGGVTVAGAKIIRTINGNTWTNALSGDGGSQYMLATYNDKLYAGRTQLGGVSSALLGTSDGVSWSVVGSLAGATNVVDMIALAGKLWIITTFAASARLYSYDGTTLSLAFTYAAGTIVRSIGVYQNKLYIGFSNGQLRQFDPVTNTDSLIVTFPGGPAPSVWSLMQFNGVLYVGTSFSRIYSYDGSAITLLYEDTVVTANIAFMAVYDNAIYASFKAADNSVVLVSKDGITWDVVYDPTLFRDIDDIYGFNDNLYVGLTTLSVTNGVATIVPDREMQYGLVDFQGGAFISPNRTTNPHRHRWVFSFDRENYINNLADKALVGFGYVPRYLALRGGN